MDIKQINYQRLNRWKERLNENGSTAMVIFGIGHGAKLGQLMVLTVEEMSDQDIIILLEGALKQIKGY